jgi:cupin 2 domain-containing protein
MEKKNLFEPPARSPEGEYFDALLETPGLRLERILSKGHVTPEGEWWDQEWPEWVVLLTGGASLRVEGEDSPIVLAPGDHVYLPAHLRHRVEWTDPERETLWLALHHAPFEEAAPCGIARPPGNRPG